jgi:membrane protein
MTDTKAAMLTETQAPVDETERGRDAAAPHDIPPLGLKDVAWRVFYAIFDDRISLIAAGVTFFMLLAFFPSMALLATIYGFFSDPVAIASQVGFLSDFLPPGTMALITDQLQGLSSQKNSTLSFAFASSFALALWSSSSGVKALFDAMNVAYGEAESRSILKLNAVALAFTLVATLLATLLIVSVGIIPVVLAFLRLDGWLELLARILRWPLALIVMCGMIMLVYRFGPSREPAKLRWITWGAAVSAILWTIATLGFSYYLSHFADYNATYGALSTLIGVMIWVWISVMILILGAEINAELEHQTLRDSTTGAPKPMGDRGAFVADTVGRKAENLEAGFR